VITTITCSLHSGWEHAGHVDRLMPIIKVALYAAIRHAAYLNEAIPLIVPVVSASYDS
jgi:hypothetical protein